MPVIKTMGHFNYIECDEQNCNRKIEHRTVKDLFTIANFAGWRETRTDDTVSHWLCPTCGVAHQQIQLPKKTKSRAKPKTKPKARTPSARAL